jgi:serine/threonine protein kinase
LYELEIILFLYDNLALKEKVGEGAFGKVWLARDGGRQEFSIKQIKCNSLQQRELVIGNRIGSNHGCSGVVLVYDSFVDDNQYYLIMEYCEEGSLSKIMKSFKQEKKIIDENV